MMDDPKFLMQWSLLVLFADVDMTADDAEIWLDDDRIQKLLNQPAVIEYFERYTPNDIRGFSRTGGGKNSKHKNPNAKANLPDSIQEIGDEIKRLISSDPFKGRKKEIERLKRKRKHIRQKP